MEDLRIGPQLTIPAGELRLSFARSGGPGGQKVNKTETKVELRWNPSQSGALREVDRAWLLRKLEGKLSAEGDLIVTSERTRTQTQNRADARDKLAELVRQALVRPKRRRPTKPGRGAVERRLREKRHLAEKKASRRERGE